MKPFARDLVVVALAGAVTACAPSTSSTAPPGVDTDHLTHAQETSASPQAVWALWMDVERWPEWDGELRAARLRDAMALGARGRLVPRRGVASTFVISEYDPPHAYAFTTTLPGAKLIVRRSLDTSGTQTRLVHDVWFEGPRADAWAARLGPSFREALPVVMADLARLAERQGDR